MRLDPYAVSILRSFCGASISKAWLGISPSVVLEAGNVIDIPGNGQRSEWYLWIQFSAWRLEIGNDVVLASADDPDERKDAVDSLRALVGVSVADVQIENGGRDLTIFFASGAVLRTFADYRWPGTEPAWELFTPGLEIVFMDTAGVLQAERHVKGA